MSKNIKTLRGQIMVATQAELFSTFKNFYFQTDKKNALQPKQVVYSDFPNLRQDVFDFYKSDIEFVLSNMAEPPLGMNAEEIIDSRFGTPLPAEYQPVNKPEVRENWRQIAARLAYVYAKAEPETSRHFWFRHFFRLLLDRIFIPNSPAIMNGGQDRNPAQRQMCMAACFVINPTDSIESFMDCLKTAALIHKEGGGTGLTGRFLRPKGASISTTTGTASGPNSFMGIWDKMTEEIKQGGRRKGANMFVQDVHHPDILDFIVAKNDQKTLTNFNISVALTDEFMEAVRKEEWYELKYQSSPESDWVRLQTCPLDPLTKQEYSYNGKKYPGKLYAPDVFQRISKSAVQWGEPGVLFIDTINKHYLIAPTMGRIDACNPCAEQNLSTNNACNLGSINWSRFVNENKVFDFEYFKYVIQVAVRMLDNTVDISPWPTPEIEKVVKRTRPIGLGPMGIADLLIKLELEYGSPDSLSKLKEIGTFFQKEAWLASLELGKEKGGFPEYLGYTDPDVLKTEANFKANRTNYQVFFESLGIFPEAGQELVPRNYEVTTVAPTGTISLIAECSSGVEPNFALAYTREYDDRRTQSKKKLTYIHKDAYKTLTSQDIDWGNEVACTQAVAFLTENKKKLPKYYVDAHELTVFHHLNVMATVQSFIDNAVSKTVNGPSSHTWQDVQDLYWTAYTMGVKSVAYYRDGSRDNQVLTSISTSDTPTTPTTPTTQFLNQANQATPMFSNGKLVKTQTGYRYDRGSCLQGFTYKPNLPNHQALYVQVNWDVIDGAPKVLEVFVSGAMSNSVGLLASRMLQAMQYAPESGKLVPVFSDLDVASLLDKIITDEHIVFNQRICRSLEQVVAECIRMTNRTLAGIPVGAVDAATYVSTLELSQVSLQSQNSTTSTGSTGFKCKKCGQYLIEKVGGCKTCRGCGDSTCS